MSTKPATFQMNPHDASMVFYKNAIKGGVDEYQQLLDDARLGVTLPDLAGESWAWARESKKAAHYAQQLRSGILESIRSPTPDFVDHLAELASLAARIPREDEDDIEGAIKSQSGAMAALVYLRLIAATGRHGSPADVLWLQWRGVGRPQNPMEKAIREAAQMARNTRAYRAQLAQERANAANPITDTQNP